MLSDEFKRQYTMTSLVQVNGLSPAGRRAIIWTIAGLLSVESLRQIAMKFLTKYKYFYERKCGLQNSNYSVSD